MDVEDIPLALQGYSWWFIGLLKLRDLCHRCVLEFQCSHEDSATMRIQSSWIPWMLLTSLGRGPSKEMPGNFATHVVAHNKDTKIGKTMLFTDSKLHTGWLHFIHVCAGRMRSGQEFNRQFWSITLQGQMCNGTHWLFTKSWNWAEDQWHPDQVVSRWCFAGFCQCLSRRPVRNPKCLFKHHVVTCKEVKSILRPWYYDTLKSYRPTVLARDLCSAASTHQQAFANHPPLHATAHFGHERPAHQGQLLSGPGGPWPLEKIQEFTVSLFVRYDTVTNWQY